MKIFFDDREFDALLLRALGYTYYGGADVGECFSTAQRIKPGDTDSWYGAWSAAAAYEHRLAALIADPGEWDTLAAVRDRIPLPPTVRDRMAPADLGRIADLSERLNDLLRHPTAGWALRRTLLVHGVSTPEELFPLLADYSLVGRAEQIRCPTLVCAADNDPISRYAPQLYQALRCPKQLLEFTSSEGAGEHCESGARSLLHQRAFDWLDGVLAPAVAA